MIEIKVFYEGEPDPVLLFWQEKEKPETLQAPPREEIKTVVLKEDPQTPETQQNQEIEALIIQQGKIYNQRCKAKNQLAGLPDNASLEESRALVNEILSLKDEYNKLARAKKEFDKTGQLPEDPAPKKGKLSDLQKHELFRERQNKASVISKTKNLVKKYQLQPDKLIKYQSKLASLEAEIIEIDELLRK